MTRAPISIASTHSILDPAFAQAEVGRHFSSWLTTAREIAAYSADLLIRALGVSDRGVDDLVTVGMIFRQNLVAFDAAVACLEVGAVQGAIPANRALLEASFGLDWILSRGKERWARQYYVSSIRQNLYWLRRLIPGTPENVEYEKAVGGLGANFDMSAPAVAERRAEETRMTALLASPAYKDINAAIEAFRNPPAPAKRRAEPNWYAYGEDSVPNVADMARGLGRLGEYATFYKYGSYHVHGSLADAHHYVSDGGAHIYPVRDLRHFPSVLSNVMTLMIEAVSKVTAAYRPAEMATLTERQLRPWIESAVSLAGIRVNATPETTTIPRSPRP